MQKKESALSYAAIHDKMNYPGEKSEHDRGVDGKVRLNASEPEFFGNGRGCESRDAGNRSVAGNKSTAVRD
ncbi:MAG: hypothetical protein ACLTZT_13265 [Butyricimonas faecalis]